jgi:hypothetical protein
VNLGDMNDTPQHIKDLQLKIWLSKSPMERLKQFMEDNEALFKFWAETKRSEPYSHDLITNASEDKLDKSQ